MERADSDRWAKQSYAKPRPIMVSAWKVRELKRQEAKMRDKLEIAMLREKLLAFEREALTWRHWYWWHQDTGPSEVEEVRGTQEAYWQRLGTTSAEAEVRGAQQAHWQRLDRNAEQGGTQQANSQRLDTTSAAEVRGSQQAYWQRLGRNAEAGGVQQAQWQRLDTTSTEAEVRGTQQCSVIDYSKWDHLGDTESEDEDEREAAAETEQEDEEIRWYYDDEDEHPDNAAYWDEEEEQEEENQDEDEKEEAEVKEDEDEEKEEETATNDDEIGDDCTSNKASILKKMQEAGDRLRRIRAEAHAATLSEPMLRLQQQLEGYHQMAMQLPESQYTKQGTKDFLKVIEQWQTEAEDRLLAWMEEEHG